MTIEQQLRTMGAVPSDVLDRWQHIPIPRSDRNIEREVALAETSKKEPNHESRR